MCPLIGKLLPLEVLNLRQERIHNHNLRTSLLMGLPGVVVVEVVVVVVVVVASVVEALDARGGQLGPETNPDSTFASAYPLLQMHPV